MLSLVTYSIDTNPAYDRLSVSLVVTASHILHRGPDQEHRT